MSLAVSTESSVALPENSELVNSFNQLSMLGFRSSRLYGTLAFLIVLIITYLSEFIQNLY